MAEGEGPIRFGILGCAAIARKMARAIAALSPSSVVLSAVGSRSLDKARRFVSSPPRAPSPPTPPCSTTPPSTPSTSPSPPPSAPPGPPSAASTCPPREARRPERRRSRPRARRLRLQRRPVHRRLHVAPPTPHRPHAPPPLRSPAVRPRQIGNLSRSRSRSTLLSFNFSISKIHSCSSFPATSEFLDHDIRVKPDLDSLGALGDLGWYCIGAILWAVNYKLPTSVAALPSPHLNESNVILACSASFHWDDDDHDQTVASFHCSFLSHGKSGSLHVRDLAIPYEESSASFKFNHGARFAELHIGWSRKPEEVDVATELPQEALMIAEFARLVRDIRDHKRPPDTKWPEISRKTQVLVDAVKRSIEMNFEPVYL